ncbi:MAG: DNA-binding response regulator [Bdellovibrionaceae bacterium]|nr:DNA-binding response regulator [Pseudobdellovibrionaceae bacterium]|tara:strand:+ start:124170 stop:125570 length:1401 start_codon:yes stop_codon:yes gene_type:complete
MQNQKVLLLDSDSNSRAALYKLFEARSCHVYSIASMAEFSNLLPQLNDIDILLGKQNLQDAKINQALRILKQRNLQMRSYVMMDSNEPVELLAMKREGVVDCFEAPYSLPEIVNSILGENLNEENISTNENLDIYQRFAFEDIIGRSPEITKVLEMVERVADSDSNILIMGESGTGKELIARALHHNSERRNQQLVPVNCGAIPNELLESELFGHIKGAFTGAIANRTGRFQLANEGTLFLDEIGDMPMTLQVKLLRVLQDQVVEPVGSHQVEKVDVRLVAATNVNLEKQVEDKKFREDLYYRLNVIPIRMPALRERTSDIPILAQHFLNKFNQKKSRNIQGISPEAMEQLISYPWPGNVRELENLMERLSVIVGEGIIQLSDLPEKYLQETTKTMQAVASDGLLGETGLDFNTVVDEFENKLIMEALEKTGWNRNQAAKLLRLNRTTLVEKIKKKGLKEQIDASL